MIKQIHLKECDSTQSALENSLPCESKNLLISTDQQLNGRGRKNSTWVQHSESIAFSFILVPMQVLTLTPIELGVLICDFIKDKLNIGLKLKWPNDLLLEKGKKVGGLIIKSYAQDQLIVGVGLNFGCLDKNIKMEKYIATSISNIKVDKEKLPLELYKYILTNRIPTTDQIFRRWNLLCDHLDKEVQIFEEENLKVNGKFLSLGKSGEALILTSDLKVQKIFSGSLVY